MLEELGALFSLLSPDEKVRAGRFYFEMDRNRFVVGRGLLRTILGGYMDMAPSQVEFVYGKYGKPALGLGAWDKPLEFNLSHSKDLALYAFSWDHRVGVDVEYIRPMPDLDDFAEQFFSPRETDVLKSLSEAKKYDAFFKLWTCKEAFLKAHGSGLTTPLNHVEISLEAEGTGLLSAIDGDSEQASRWHLESFSPMMGYRASLAIEGHAGQVVIMRESPTC
ncbi:MAG: 4'-phosphopantetheinyl transferase superfamily protein [Anaerolineales bacterium]